MKEKTKIYLVLLLLTVITAGGSILYLTQISNETGGIVADFPAIEKTMPGDYAILAKNLVESGIFSRNTEPPYESDAWRTPGYPLFIAPFYALFGTFHAALVAQIGILFLTVILIFKMAESIIGRKLAFILSILYLLLPGTILSASVLLSENVFVFVFLLTLYVLFFSTWKHYYLQWSIGGLLLAATVYIRPASLYILPFFLFGYFAFYLNWRDISRKQIIGAIFLSIVFIGSLLPWNYRNLEQLDKFTFTSSSAFVLFRQNAVQFYEAYNDVPNIEARYALQDRAGIPRGRVPDDLEHYDILKEVALDVITEHPIDYAIFHLITFIPFFTSSSVNTYSNYVGNLLPDTDHSPEPSLIQAINPFSFPTLMIVLKNHGWTLVENVMWAFVTLLVFISLWWSKNTRLSRMFFILILYFALVTGPIAHARYRMPVEPLLLISAFSAAAFLWERKDPIIKKIR